MKIVKLIKEGEDWGKGYAFVRHRVEFLGGEVALIPFHWVLKLYHYIRKSSYHAWTDEEIRSNKMTLEIMNMRGDRRYIEGYDKGKEAGEIHATHMFVLMMEQADKMDREISCKKVKE